MSNATAEQAPPAADAPEAVAPATAAPAAVPSASSATPASPLGAEEHPLQYTWTLWYSKSTSEWNPQPVVDFNSVEGFWRLYNNLVPAGSLPPGADYFLFKKGIKPAWEDEKNVNGGVWSIEMPPHADQAANNAWLWTLLALIGEYFQKSEDISGAVISARPRCFRLALWTQTAADDAVQQSIAHEWGLNMSDVAPAPPAFKPHNDAKRK